MLSEDMNTCDHPSSGNTRRFRITNTVLSPITAESSWNDDMPVESLLILILVATEAVLLLLVIGIVRRKRRFLREVSINAIRNLDSLL
jgi:hypothetical protein